MKVCIFGDSVTKGIVYDDEKEKYVFLEDSFVHLFQQEQQIGVKNFSKFGCTTCKGVKILDAHVEELENFDYTVLEFGGNDCDYNWKDVSETPDQNHLPNVPLKKFVACYKNMLAKIIKSGSKPIMLSLPPLHAPGFFRCISKGLNKENILKFIHEIEFIYRWQELYNTQLFEIAYECHVPIIDIRKEFLQEKDYETCLCSDGMHPNKKGHGLILNALHKVMEKEVL